MNSWIYLFVAGIFEMGWVLALKFSENFTKLLFAVLTVVFMILSLIFLSFSFKSIPMGTAIGAVGVIIFGIFFLGESANLLRLFFIGLVITGIIGLKLTAS